MMFPYKIKSSIILKISISVAIFIFFVQYITKNYSYVQFKELCRHVNSMNIFFAVLIHAFAHILFSTRLCQLLRIQFKFNVPQAIQMHFLGASMNLFLPWRFGDFLRIAIFKKYFDKDFLTALPLTLAERIFDIVILISALFISICYVNIPDDIQNNYIAAAKAIAIPIVIFISAVYFYIKLIRKEKNLNFKAKKIQLLIYKFQHIFNVMAKVGSRKNIFLLLATSLFGWIMIVISFYFFLISFNMNLNLFEIIFLVTSSQICSSIPISPASIGIYHAIVITTLSIFGITPDKSIAFAILTHLSISTTQLLGGLISSAFIIKYRPSISMNL